jgi:peptide/nickel transport system ATP-binding protein
VTAPQHPYTQLLVSAIPRAHAARDWLTADEEPRRATEAAEARGCVFAERCPYTVSGCLAAQPALYRTEPRRAVACVRYQPAPALAASNLGEVLVGPAGLEPATAPL